MNVCSRWHYSGCDRIQACQWKRSLLNGGGQLFAGDQATECKKCGQGKASKLGEQTGWPRLNLVGLDNPSFSGSELCKFVDHDRVGPTAIVDVGVWHPSQLCSKSLAWDKSLP